MFALFLMALTIAAFWPTLSNGFVSYDDDRYVTGNPHLQSGLSTQTIAWAFTTFRASNWHPLTWISHALDCQLYGMNPLGHHATNLLLHIANVLLLFWILVHMTKSRWQSAFVAALFAVHPLHVESVAWIAERKDVLSTFFWMLTMLAYVRYTESPTLRRYLPVMAAYGLGLLAKPMLVTLPFALVLLDYWPLGRSDQSSVISHQSGKGVPGTRHRAPWHLVLEKVPLFALAAASCAITFIAQRTGGSVAGLEISPAQRIGNALVSYVCYMVKMLWPSGLACFYPRASIQTWQALLSGMTLLGMTVLAIRMARRRPYLLTGWLWYVGTLVPVIGLVQVGMQSMADRYTYIPLIGIFIMLAWGVPELLGKGEREKGRKGELQPSTSNAQCSRKKSRRQPSTINHQPFPITRHLSPVTAPLVATAIAIVVILATCTNLQARHWHDSTTLFEYAIAVTEGNYIAHNNLGQILTSERRFDEAIAHYRKALETDPDPGLTYSNLGAALAETGHFDEAMENFRLSVKSDPECAEGHTNLGRGLCLQGKSDEAMKHLSIALKLDPENPMPHLAMGELIGRMGHFNKAIPEFEKAIALKPDLAAAHYNLAIAYYTKGNYSAAWAEVHLTQRHGLNPDPRFLQSLSQKMPEAH